MNERSGGLWQPGDRVLIKNVWEGVVRYAEPVTVVEDVEDRLTVFTRSGTPTMWSWIDWAKGEFDGPRDHAWHSTDVLKILEAGKRYAIWLMWEEHGGPFIGWYVNLQAPFVRTPSGVVTWDQSLDIVVDPARNWRWKDEDDFDRIQSLGWVTDAEAAEIRKGGEEAIQRIERRGVPFCDPWPEWKPDPGWPLPSIPADWKDASR